MNKTCIKQALLTLVVGLGVTQMAFAAPTSSFPQSQMDQLHNFFSRAQIASDATLITIGQPPATLTPEAQKMAQMMSTCQIQKQSKGYNSQITINGANCPVAYFTAVSVHPQVNGSQISMTVERNKMNTVPGKVLTGLNEYSTSSSMTTTAASVQGTTRKRYVSADGTTIVSVQQISTITTNVNDREDYTITYGSQSYTAEILRTGSTSTCLLNGASATCADFDYVMGQSSSR
jgi:hypothetical protein